MIFFSNATSIDYLVSLKTNVMQRLLLVALACLLSVSLSAQSPIWEWGTGWATNFNELQDIAVNNLGESYVIGQFTGGQILFNNTFSGSGAYVAKFDELGSF